MALLSAMALRATPRISPPTSGRVGGPATRSTLRKSLATPGVLVERVVVALPLPASLCCEKEECKGAKGAGPWFGESKHNQLLNHYRTKHARQGVRFALTFTCQICTGEFEAKNAATKHFQICLASLAKSQADEERGPAEIADDDNNNNSIILSNNNVTVYQAIISVNDLIIPYPGSHTRCPLCPKVYIAERSALMNSVHKHVEQVHGIKLNKKWSCKNCTTFVGDGYALRSHYRTCKPVAQASPIPVEAAGMSCCRDDAPATVNLTNDGSPFIHRQDGQKSQSPVIGCPVDQPDLSKQESSTDGSVVDLAGVPEPEPATTSEGPAEVVTEADAGQVPEDSSSPSRPACDRLGQADEELLGPGSQQSEVGSVEAAKSQEFNTSEEAAVKRLFRAVWIKVFNNCKSINDLNSSIDRCSRDWLEKASKFVSLVVETTGENNNNQNNKNLNSKPKKRNQRRQLLKHKNKIKKDFYKNKDNDDHISKLFMIYPKRAVRKVLGEQSASYSGSASAASDFLTSTYERPRPTDGEREQVRAIYASCAWDRLSQKESDWLGSPPIREEIEAKLKKASNTAPGLDGLEYRHLRALDPAGDLLAVIYSAVWRLGIPQSWKISKTIFIYKKGQTDDLSNFRPISLLPTMYKVMSGIVSGRLVGVAMERSWLSAEQKGFLPGVHGMQEHTELLESVIEDSQEKRSNSVITWLDLCNAFGSIPHAYLQELFDSLPIPDSLRKLLSDVYLDNSMRCMVAKTAIDVEATAGVRQGDALSTTIFNLAAEPLIRAAKSEANPGYTLFYDKVKATAFADDLAVVSASVASAQATVDRVNAVASDLGLKFNADKCACLHHKKGANSPALLLVDGKPIKSLDSDGKISYLGIPMGTKLRFSPPTELVQSLHKVADSGLFPWQKLEVYRSHLLPALAHHLASARALKKDLRGLDVDCRAFLAKITTVGRTAATPFYYADRQAGALGTCSLADDADIWTIARAAQLLSSEDPTVKSIFWAQLQDTIGRAFIKTGISEPNFPYANYLSGSDSAGLYRLKFASTGRANLWTLARKAAARLGVQIDVSSDKSLTIIADDVSVLPSKAVRGLRSVVRARWTGKFLAAKHQGQVASGLVLDKMSKDTAKQISIHTDLNSNDWTLLHRARLDLLPLIGYQWGGTAVKKCRCCRSDVENVRHLTSNCRIWMRERRARHDEVLEDLKKILEARGFQVRSNKCWPGSELRPDLEVEAAGTKTIIDVTVAFDEPGNMQRAFDRKVEKYQHLSQTFPLVLGALGSWKPENEAIRSFFGIPARQWAAFRRRSRTSVIRGSLDIIRRFLVVVEPVGSSPSQHFPPDTWADENVTEPKQQEGCLYSGSAQGPRPSASDWTSAATSNDQSLSTSGSSQTLVFFPSTPTPKAIAGGEGGFFQNDSI